MAEIYLCRFDAGADRILEQLQHHLLAEEQGRAQRFKVPHARRIYVLAHSLLHIVLARYGVHVDGFARNPFGKPELPSDAGLHFNLSHTNGLVAVAIGQLPLGLDVEGRTDGRDMDMIARRVFTETERREMAKSADPADRFCQLWTCKEALMKAVGMGFSLPAQSLELVGPDPALRKIPSEHGAAASWALYSTRLDDHRLALASRREFGMPDMHWLNWADLPAEMPQRDRG